MNAQAEIAPKPQGDTSSELVEGLLDLLAEPKRAGSEMAPSSAVQPNTSPLDGKLDGRDSGGASSTNPLDSVRQDMLIAAGLLRGGVTSAETQQLQSGILERLDDFIRELERSPTPNRSRSEKQPAPSEQPKNEDGQQQARAGDPSKGEGTPPSNQPEQPGQPNGTPSDQSTERPPESLVVDLADPKSMQRQVWGQLPERVRQQMQSRMVEHFLPAYREQIEAYFQALLK